MTWSHLMSTDPSKLFFPESALCHTISISSLRTWRGGSNNPHNVSTTLCDQMLIAHKRVSDAMLLPALSSSLAWVWRRIFAPQFPALSSLSPVGKAIKCRTIRGKSRKDRSVFLNLLSLRQAPEMEGRGVRVENASRHLDLIVLSSSSSSCSNI